MKSNSQMAGDNLTGKDNVSSSTLSFLAALDIDSFFFGGIRIRCSTKPRTQSEWAATIAAATTTTELIVSECAVVSQCPSSIVCKV